MVKLYSILRLRPNVNPVEAYKYWREKHVIWEKEKLLPEIRRYSINKVIHKYRGAGGKGEDFDIFGYTLCHFDDKESALKAMKRLQGVQPDEFLTKYVTEQRVIAETKQIDIP